LLVVCLVACAPRLSLGDAAFPRAAASKNLPSKIAKAAEVYLDFF